MIRSLLVPILILCLAILQSCDPCRKLDCVNGGECYEGNCICEEGYIGETCQQEDREKFLARWEASDQCIAGSNVFELDISEGTEVRQLAIRGLYRYTVYDPVVIGVVNDRNVNIPVQPFGHGQIHGEGTLNSTTLTIRYFVIGNGNYDECEIVAEKIF